MTIERPRIHFLSNVFATVVSVTRPRGTQATSMKPERLYLLFYIINRWPRSWYFDVPDKRRL